MEVRRRGHEATGVGTCWFMQPKMFYIGRFEAAFEAPRGLNEAALWKGRVHANYIPERLYCLTVAVPREGVKPSLECRVIVAGSGAYIMTRVLGIHLWLQLICRHAIGKTSR